MTANLIANGKVNVGDVELEVFHKGAGAPMLLLHGDAGIDHRARFLELLAARFEVIAPSHPGFGRSPLPDLFDSVDDLAYLYLDLLDTLDLREVVVVGFSLGGWVAAEIAVRCAHRMKRLVLVGPVGIKVSDRETRDIPDIFALSPAAIARLTFHDPARAAIDFSAMSDDELRIIARNRESLALYTWEPYMHNPKLRYLLGRIRIPSLLMRGESDGLISQSYIEAYTGLIPGARLELIGEAGHSPELERPDEFARRLIAFAAG